MDTDEQPNCVRFEVGKENGPLSFLVSFVELSGNYSSGNGVDRSLTTWLLVTDMSEYSLR